MTDILFDCYTCNHMRIAEDMIVRGASVEFKCKTCGYYTQTTFLPNRLLEH